MYNVREIKTYMEWLFCQRMRYANAPAPSVWWDACASSVEEIGFTEAEFAKLPTEREAFNRVVHALVNAQEELKQARHHASG